jgi:hypothetical protein
MIHSLLIANRAKIASPIIHTLRAFALSREPTLLLLSPFDFAQDVLRREGAKVRPHPRRPELVSGPTVPLRPVGGNFAWMLKRVQHDGLTGSSVQDDAEGNIHA